MPDPILVAARDLEAGNVIIDANGEPYHVILVEADSGWRRISASNGVRHVVLTRPDTESVAMVDFSLDAAIANVQHILEADLVIDWLPQRGSLDIPAHRALMAGHLRAHHGWGVEPGLTLPQMHSLHDGLHADNERQVVRHVHPAHGSAR